MNWQPISECPIGKLVLLGTIRNSCAYPYTYGVGYKDRLGMIHSLEFWPQYPPTHFALIEPCLPIERTPEETSMVLEVYRPL